MKKLLKWVAAAACALPLAAMAGTTAGYEDFGDVAGVVLWRATQTTFHDSTVADVSANGTVGDEYAMLADQSAKSWKRFASNQTAYSAPGMLLVYDKASSDDETPVDYTQNSEPDFGPLSFGGLWVQTLAANGSPFKLADSGSRATEFGNASYSGTTLFKFDKSFTIDRQGTFSFLGTVNLAVAQDAVFTINPSYPAQSIVVASGSTLAPSGAGTITLNTAGLTVNGTLDLTASTLPTISGNVRFASGSSLVLPAGVATGEAISVAVCSGTLTADGVVSVKIGTADPINAALTISGGAITQIDEAVVEQTFTSDYPSVVPAGYIYTFTTSVPTTLPSVTVKGTLKTEGDFSITDLTVAASGALDVVSGNTTVGGAATKQLSGNITVRSGATLTNTLGDSLNYNGAMTVDIYGTLAMGTTRWSIPDGCTFKVHGGATVTGTGDGYGVLDFLAANDRGLDVYADSSASSVTIEGAVRVRNNNTRIWVASGMTLVLQSGIVEKNQQAGSFKQTGPGTLEICATQTGLTGGTSTMHQGTLRLNNTTTAIPLAFNGTAALEIVATDAATTVPVNVTSINGNGVTLTGNGKANGTITKTAAPSGNLATFLQSSAWEGTFVADWAGANGTRFDINSYGNANSTVRVTKLVGGYASDDSVDNFTVIPTVEVSGFMTLDNGYSGKVTTLTKLTGSGVFTNKTYSVDVTTLDNFTGTLATLISTQYIGMRIGTINLSSTPAAGAKIVNITSDSNIGNIANTKVSVNGVVDDTIALEVKSDGIYVAVPATTVDITIPEVANATVSVTADGVAVTPVNGVVTVDIGAAVVVTYTAAEGYQLTGDAISFTASASTTTVDVSNISVAAIVANVTSADGQTTTPYTSAASAIAAADDGETVTLLEATVTLTEILTVSKSIAIASGNASGTTITGSGLSVYPQLAAANLTVGANVMFGSQLRVTSSDATITYPTGSVPNYRPPSGYQSQTTDNANDTSTITFYQQVYVIAAGTNATLADENGNQLGSFTPVASGGTFVFTVTPAAGCALVRVTADGVELTPSEGKYSISIGSSNVSIYAVAGVAVVTGGDSDEYCSSLRAAVDAATSGQTVTLLADDRVSFTEDNLELSIGKALTIDGAGHTIYGVNDYTGGKGDHDIYISGSGDVTIKNVTLAEFGGAVANNMRTYPIWTGSAYTGTLTLDNVTVRNFNRTAFNLNGGTVVVKDCTITGDKSKDTYFQSGIEAYNANVTVQGTTTITGTGSNLVDWPEAACLQLGNPNGSVAGAGSITVTGGTFTGDYGIIVASNASEVVSVTGGTFNGVLEVEDGEGGSLAISGGTFNAVVPEEYLAEGYEVLDNGDGTYGVRVDKGWVYAAQGYWNYTGAWTGVTPEDDDQKVTIEDGARYTATKASAGTLVTLDMTMSFDDINDDNDDLGDAKAAIRLGEGETEGTYVFQLYTYENSAAVWKNATGFTPEKETDYNIVFVLDLTNKTYTASVITGAGATTNALSVGGSKTIAFANQGEVTPVQTIDFVGSGTVSSIEGSYEDAPEPEGFVENQVIGGVTLTSAQAAWLNGQSNYDALAAKIATMTATAFNDAYLLNLDILASTSGYVFAVTDIDVGTGTVDVKVQLTRTGALTENEKAKPIVGTLKLKGTATLGTAFTELATEAVEFDTDADFGNGATETKVKVDTDETDAKFYQAVIE